MTEVTYPAPDSVVIMLLTSGQDDNRPASISKKGSIGPNRCTLRKEVMFLETATSPAGVPLFRHEYRFRR